MKYKLKLLFLHTCWYLGLFHVSKWLMRNKVLILCYHGYELQDETQFRPKLFIKPDTFDRRMRILAENGFNILPLQEALQQMDDDRLAPNTLSITIDDGFFGVLEVAADILQKYKMPAMLYQTTYYSEKRSPIFRLVAQYMFWKTPKTQVSFDGCVWRSQSGTVDLTNTAESEKVLWECIDYGETHGDEALRRRILEQVGDLLDVPYAPIEASRIMSLLTPEEVASMADKNIDIQLHTHRHRFPPEDESVARQEILDNRTSLGTMIAHQVEHFCYPSGVWASHQWPWLASLGVISATTCNSGMIDKHSPKLGLTRFLDGEYVSDIEFKSEVYGFIEVIRQCKKWVGR